MTIKELLIEFKIHKSKGLTNKRAYQRIVAANRHINAIWIKQNLTKRGFNVHV